jgi:hypothetical protein
MIAATSPVNTWAGRDIRRLWLLLLVAAYYMAFQVSYREFLEPGQGYFGFSLNPVPFEHLVLCWAVVLIPALWLPLSIRRPSQVLFLLQYFVLFIPATIVVYNAGRPRLAPQDAALLVTAMFAGLTIWQATYLLPLLRLERARLAPGLFWTLFGAGMLLCLGLVASVLGSNFRLANLVDIYDVRFAAAERLGSASGQAANYAQGWLLGFFLPLTLAAGALLQRRILVLAAVLGYMFLFGVAGAKSALIAAPLLLGLAVWSRARSGPETHMLVVALTAALLFPAVFRLFGALGEFLELWYVALVHSRIFGIPQLLMAQYLEYFGQHPYTYWSHVHGIDVLVGYPYDLDVPRVLGSYYYGPDVGSNAGLWAQDGIAAIGLAGIPLVSLIAAAFLWFFDSVARGLPLSLTVVSVGFIAISFTNTSFATTLVTGGALLLLVALWFMPLPVRQPIPDVGASALDAT